MTTMIAGIKSERTVRFDCAQCGQAAAATVSTNGRRLICAHCGCYLFIRTTKSGRTTVTLLHDNP